MSTQTQLNQSGTDVVGIEPQSSAALSSEQLHSHETMVTIDDEIQNILDAALIYAIDEDDGIINTGYNKADNNSTQKRSETNDYYSSSADIMIEQQPKLNSLIHQITNANDVNDIEPIINHLNAFDEIKQLLLDKINELPLYDETKENVMYTDVNNDNIYGKQKKQNVNIKFSNNSNNNNYMDPEQVQIEEEEEEYEDENDSDINDSDINDINDTNSESDNEMNQMPNKNTKLFVTHSSCINNLYYQCTEISKIFNDEILCRIIIYVSKSSMYRKIPILSKYFMHLMKNCQCLYKQYTIEIPYTVYTSKTSKLYGKIIHETCTIKIYTKLQILKDYTINNATESGGNMHYLNIVDMDDNRTINSADINGLGSNDSHITNQSITYDIDSIDLEFEINDIQDLSDNIAYNIWISIPKWSFTLIHQFNNNDNKYVNQNKKWNEILNQMLEKASSNIQCVTINKSTQNTIISPNDIIHFAMFDGLKYLNACNDFIITFLDYSNECNYILSNLLCVDFIEIEENIINIINNNLPRLLILSLQFEQIKDDKNDIKIAKEEKQYVIKLPKTLEFLQIHAFDFSSKQYSLDFTQCNNLICVKFKDSQLIRDELLDHIICKTIQQQILWTESLIQCFIIDEIDREYNSCWFRYFESFASSQNQFFEQKDNSFPKIQYIRYMDDKNLRIVDKKYKQMIESKELDMSEEQRTSRPITASPMLQYNNSLSIHDDDDDNMNDEIITTHVEHINDSLYHNPLEQMTLTRIKEIGHKKHNLYTILSDYNNDGILWKLLIENKYKNENDEILKDKLNVYKELIDMHVIKWIKSLGYQKPFLPFVNFSIPNRF